MNEYHIIFYFSDKVNVSTNVNSELEIKDFTEEFNMTLQKANKDFINLIGQSPQVMINRNNLLFYTIEKIEDNKRAYFDKLTKGGD